MVEAPRREWELRMEIAAAPRAGAIVARLDGAIVRRGAFTLGPVSLQVEWADRIAITGANGSGKSTLLAALLGRIPLDAGSARLGPGVVVGEVDQARGALPRRAAACSTRSAPRCRTCCRADVRTLLAKFGLRGRPRRPPGRDALARRAHARRRSRCSRPAGVNLLVLDEPTNHLDLPAIEQLESALDDLRGHPAAGHARPAHARGRRRPTGASTSTDGQVRER